jgi:hypothetical protein
LTITASPASVLSSVIRDQTFSRTITFSATAGETIFSANCVKNFVDSNVTIANGVSSVVISGKHITAFDADEIKYVDKGSSDRLQTPVVSNKFADVPANKDLFEVNQDPSASKTRTYTVTVVHSAGVNTFNFSQLITNGVTVGYNFLKDYY